MGKVLVTGGAGYVGAVLVPKLLAAGFDVTVLDLYLYGDNVLDAVRHDSKLLQIKGDLRDPEVLNRALTDCDAVIHLACISNDPSFELNPELGKSINFDAFRPLVEVSREKGVRRFVFASSSSVYGVKEEERVTEALPPAPLTDYSRFKVLCEQILWEYQSPDFTCVTLRPATVCGYSPRLRLDLTDQSCYPESPHPGFRRIAISTEHPYRRCDRLLHSNAAAARGGRRRKNVECGI
jgi:nucleoside-diphosphate-sugar epimerase